jgi:hypothetical protein
MSLRIFINAEAVAVVLSSRQDRHQQQVSRNRGQTNQKDSQAEQTRQSKWRCGIF